MKGYEQTPGGPVPTLRGLLPPQGERDCSEGYSDGLQLLVLHEEEGAPGNGLCTGALHQALAGCVPVTTATRGAETEGCKMEVTLGIKARPHAKERERLISHFRQNLKHFMKKIICCSIFKLVGLQRGQDVDGEYFKGHRCPIHSLALTRFVLGSVSSSPDVWLLSIRGCQGVMETVIQEDVSRLLS